jgi:hypothetical protein
MRREGAFVENAWFKGRWSSEYLYAVLRDEWLQRPREGELSEGERVRRQEKGQSC